MLATIERRFRAVAPPADFCSLRFCEERSEQVAVHRGVVQPFRSSTDAGAMLSVRDGGGIGYAATSDLSEAGLRRAAQQALDWARETAGRSDTDFSALEPGVPRGSFESAVVRPWQELSLGEKLDLVLEPAGRLKAGDAIVDWTAALWQSDQTTLYLTADGGRVEQRFHFLSPMLSATANRGADTQTRTLGRHAFCRQGGLEVLDEIGYAEAAGQVADEALELLDAPNCPSGQLDVVLAPDQMIIQLHESIGHPLELDRILGDERNYAGTSFVTPDMFGSYRYGSELLNVVFEPGRAGQLASYAFDDDGSPAERQHLIRDGILLRGLGGAISQARTGLPGVASSRASGWNRPPIDRMGNLNLEPSDASLDELVGRVERGLYLQTNCSWSIDDSRNKFQFGCERARRIQDGELGEVLKNPNYRGISATFWRSLTGVGNAESVSVLGTPNCGKGEPNQAIRVGHASPTCLFENVSVFGGV